MSITEYLNSLSLEQLEFAKEEAERLIQNIRNQQRIGLLVVSDPHANVACFTEDQFKEAKGKLCEIIMSDDFKIHDIYSDHPRINLVRVFESEVDEWMRLNR